NSHVPYNGDELAFTITEIIYLFYHSAAVLSIHLLYKLIRTYNPRSLLHLYERHIQRVQPYVRFHRTVENEGILEHKSNLLLHLLFRQFSDRLSVNQYFPFFKLIEPHEQAADRTFS